MSATQEAASGYSQEILFERQAFFAGVEALRRASQVPTVSGFTINKVGTNKPEQGISYAECEHGPVVGYHLIDPTAIPVAGALERQAYQLQRSLKTLGAVRHLFGDPIFHKKFNLRVAGPEASMPVLSFYFSHDGERFGLQEIRPSLFHATANLSYEHDDIDSPQESTDVQSVVDTLTQHAELPERSMFSAKYFLRRVVGEFAAGQLASHGLPIIKDEAGNPRIHRPMRSWSDFKNLQVFKEIVNDRVPLFTATQWKAMTERAAGGADYDPAVLEPSRTAKKLLSLLQSTFSKNHFVRDAVFNEFEAGFDPDRTGDDPLLVHILHWAEQHGLLTTATESEKRVFHFKNLKDHPVSVRLSGANQQEVAYEALISYLQRCPRQPVSPQASSKELMRQFQTQASARRIKQEEDRRFVQSFWRRVSPGHRS